MQSDLDAANAQIAPLQSDLDVVESDLATAESDLAASQSAKATAEEALAAAEARIPDLEAQVAELEAAVPEGTVVEEVPEFSFTPVTYTNADYGFSLQYPDFWEEKTNDPAEGVVWRFGDPATYNMPSVRVIVRDEADGATLEEVFTLVLESDGKAITSFEASDVTINDTDFTQGVVVYPHSTYGDYDSLIIGLITDGKWVIIEAYGLAGLGAVWPDEAMQAEIIGTVTFE